MGRMSAVDRAWQKKYFAFLVLLRKGAGREKCLSLVVLGKNKSI